MTKYKFISDYIFRLLTRFEIEEYPINLNNVINCLKSIGLNIDIDTYSAFAKFKNTTVDHVVKNTFKSKDGATAFVSQINTYIIFYNDKTSSEGRKRWTISHELGHILLKHYKKMSPVILMRSGLSKIKYKAFEDEADHFAKLLLCHPLVLIECNLNSSQQIAQKCRISKQAASNRVLEVTKNKNRTIRDSNEWDCLIVDHFYNFINRKHCMNCDHLFYNKDTIYCPICGQCELKWEDKGMVYDDGFELDENGHVYMCPICQNQDISLDRDHCRICGTYLINQCSNADGHEEGYNYIEACGKPAHKNSRYCEYCGSTTTFFNWELLKPWDQIRDSILAKQEAACASDTNSTVEFWSSVLNEIKTRSQKLYDFLSGTQINFDNNTLYICFSPSPGTIENMAKNKDSMDIIKSIVNKRILIKDVVFFTGPKSDNFIRSAEQIVKKLNVPYEIIDE